MTESDLENLEEVFDYRYVQTCVSQRDMSVTDCLTEMC